MISFVLYGEDAKPDSPFQLFFKGALGKAIILSEAATTVNGLVPEGEVGFYETSLKLYFTIGGNTYSTPALTLV